MVMHRRSTPNWNALVLLLICIVPLLAACGAPEGTPAAQNTEPTTASAASEPAAPEPTQAAPTEEALATEPPSEPSAPDPVEAATDGKVLRVQTSTYPDVVDPQKSSFANEISILSLNYEGLTKLDKDLKAVPAAAEKWEFSEAGDVITFTLRPDLKYSDGTPLTSENFRYAVERTCNPETAGEYQSILFEIIGCQDFATAADD